MSVTMTKNEGVTVVTLTSDPESSWPPLCQIFKSLCYNPVCCSVSQDLRKIRRSSQSVLGTLQIMVGLFNFGFGVVLHESGTGWKLDGTRFPVSFGVLFIVFGIMCILSEKYPSPCLVILTVVLNLAGVVFAITAIFLYCISIAYIYVEWFCDRYDGYYGYRRYSTNTPSPERDALQEKCLEARDLTQMLVRGIFGVLIVLSVLELCVVISSVVLGIKALRRREKESNKSSEQPEPVKATVGSNH